MIDLSTAFNMVDHQILLQVLQSRFGVSGSALAWFDLYLWPRFCKVKVGKKFSTIRSLDCLVPQGSLAGPNLYSAYASILQEIVPENVGLNGFADDHSLKRSLKQMTEGRADNHFYLTKLSHECKDLDGWEQTMDEWWKDRVYYV